MSDAVQEDTTSTNEPEATVHEPQSIEELPSWAQEEIRRTRSEAAGYRTQRNELTSRVEELTSKVQEMEELSATVETVRAEKDGIANELGKLKAVIKAGIPADQAEAFATRLQGSTPEEWEEDAQSLQQLLGMNKSTSRVDPSQGASTPGLNSSTLEQQLTQALR